MYPYLVASLPRLQLGAPVPISRDELARRCRELLPEEDAREATAALEGRTEAVSTAAGRRWHDLDTQLRNAVARRRAQALDTPAPPHLRPHAGYRTDVDAAVEAAFAETDPARRERSLDELRWRLLGEIEAVDRWGLPAVLAYALRLRLAERWARFDTEAGWAALDGFLADLETGHESDH